MIAAGLLLLALSASPFLELAPGLEQAELAMPARSSHGDSKVTVLRIDPARWELSLASAKLDKLPAGLPAPTWAALKGLAAATNAGMFDLSDMKTPVGYARVEAVELNPKWSKYQGVIVTGPRDPGLPAVQILDSSCGIDAKKESARYRVALQTILMVDCKGRNSWPVRPRKWSAVVFALDQRGRVLWIHSRSPYEPHAFIDHLLSLPLSIVRMAYLEGGPEASLFADVGGQRLARVGSFETDFRENDTNREFWDLPNVFGIRPRAAAGAQ